MFESGQFQSFGIPIFRKHLVVPCGVVISAVRQPAIQFVKGRHIEASVGIGNKISLNQLPLAQIVARSVVDANSRQAHFRTVVQPVCGILKTNAATGITDSIQIGHLVISHIRGDILFHPTVLNIGKRSQMEIPGFIAECNHCFGRCLYPRQVESTGIAFCTRTVCEKRLFSLFKTVFSAIGGGHDPAGQFGMAHSIVFRKRRNPHIVFSFLHYVARVRKYELSRISQEVIVEDIRSQFRTATTGISIARQSSVQHFMGHTLG